MRRCTTSAGIAAALALMATPALALSPQVPTNSGTTHAAATPGTTHAAATPGTTHAAATPGSQHAPQTRGHGATDNPDSANRLAAPGQYCKAESKKHVSGQKGTPFSVCVRAQAKLRSGATDSPRTACKDESKKHVSGQEGTPFSKCVTAGAKLLRDADTQNDDDKTATS
jgi:hypothetical protein